MTNFGGLHLFEIRPKSIDFEVFAHATEDEDKVLQAVLNLIPDRFKDEIKTRRDVLKGHYRNQIVVYRMKILEKKLVEESLLYLFSKFDKKERLLLSKELEMRLDETGVLHLRIDKQSAYRGRPIFRPIDDAIKVRVSTVKPSTLTNKGIIESYKRHFLVK